MRINRKATARHKFSKFFLLSVIGILTFSLSSCGVEQKSPQEEVMQTTKTTTRLAMVNEVIPEMTDDKIINLLIKGDLRNGCESLGDMTMKQVGMNINATLYVKVSGEICTQALTPFERNFPLDGLGMADGQYTFNVNDTTATLDVKKEETAE